VTPAHLTAYAIVTQFQFREFSGSALPSDWFLPDEA